MIVKNAHHQQFLLEALQQLSIPGKYLDLAFEVKQELASAKLESQVIVADRPKDEPTPAA
jgi:hypothetical protein